MEAEEAVEDGVLEVVVDVEVVVDAEVAVVAVE